MRRETCGFLLTTLLAVALPGQTKLPLPEAPVRVVIPDADAFDAALSGGYRAALEGSPAESDPVAAGWRRSQVGSKLQSQWELFSGDFDLSWRGLKAVKPRSIGLAILEVASLEAVLVLETSMPLPKVPAGTAKTHREMPYALVEKGAGDEPGQDRRMGLAWAKVGGFWVLATSERALLLALDQVADGAGSSPFLPGFVSLELDMNALSKDLYFRREFLFGPATESGRIRAALSVNAAGSLEEIREGTVSGNIVLTPAPRFEAGQAAASGWIPDSKDLFSALRRGFLETIPSPSDLPATRRRDLPETTAGEGENPYLVDLRAPILEAAKDGEEGELTAWKAFFTALAPSGWGYRIGRDGSRVMTFPCPAEKEAEFGKLARATIERRAGRVRSVEAPGGGELQVGPGLPAMAWKRTGGFLWLALQRSHLEGLSEPRSEAGLARWGSLELDWVRGRALEWARAEGVATPETSRPFSDRILGLLGWSPKVKRITVERRQDARQWREKVVFSR